MSDENSEPTQANGKTNPCHRPQRKPGVPAAWSTASGTCRAQAARARSMPTVAGARRVRPIPIPPAFARGRIHLRPGALHHRPDGTLTHDRGRRNPRVGAVKTTALPLEQEESDWRPGPPAAGEPWKISECIRR